MHASMERFSQEAAIRERRVLDPRNERINHRQRKGQLVRGAAGAGKNTEMQKVLLPALCNRLCIAVLLLQGQGAGKLRRWCACDASP